MTAIKAIRAYCLDCSGDSAHEVKYCPYEKCPLFRFRFGKNPNIKRKKLTEEQKEVLAERLKKSRTAHKNNVVA